MKIKVAKLTEGLRDRLADAADRYGTPLYVYDATQLRATARRILDAHRVQQTRFYYFEPANRNVEILRTIRHLGFGITVTRPAGVYRALELGFPAHQIECSGFGFSSGELRFVHEHGAWMNLGTLAELAQFRAMFPDAAVGIRIDFSESNQEKRGVPSELLLSYLGENQTSVVGLHSYIGSNIISTERHTEALKRLVSLIPEVERMTKRPIQCVNVGGGLGHDYVTGNTFEWETHGVRVHEEAKRLEKRVKRDLIVKVEVGRSLVVDCGFLVVKVLQAFTKQGRNFVVVNSNISHFARPVRYGFHKNLHPFMTDGVHRFAALSGNSPSAKNGSGTEVAVVGNSHYSKDWLGMTRFPEFDPNQLPGTLLAVLDAGAYCESMSDHWADEPRPASALLDDDNVRLITPREDYSDLFGRDLHRSADPG
jgi:diaminopimelate decarboxylase